MRLCRSCSVISIANFLLHSSFKSGMTARLLNIVLFAGLTLLLFSCEDTPVGNRGPIILGDSSLMVIETDEEQLKDLVTDLKPEIPRAEDNYAAEEEEKAPETDTAKTAAAEPEKEKTVSLPKGKGLRAEFKQVTVVIPGLNVKMGRDIDLKKAYGVAYFLNDGDINGSTMHLEGEITRVSQRYQSIVVMSSVFGDIPLGKLLHTAEWEEIKGSNNTYPIRGLKPSELDYKRANTNSIHYAIRRAGQRRHLSRRNIQELLNGVRRVRSVKQKPFRVALKTVMWKIDGRDKDGKPFSKQVRIDIPM